MPNQIRFILVEDSPYDEELLLRWLKKGGYLPIYTRVYTLDGLRDLIISDLSWEIVLCDFKLPGFTAFDSLKLLKELAPDLSVIIVSGKVGEEIVVDLMKAGAKDFVSKDKLERLIPVIERELSELAVREEKQNAEAALKASEERFSTIANNSETIIYEIKNNCFVYSNPACLSLLGYDSVELSEYSFLDIVHPDFRKSISGLINRQLEEKVPFNTVELKVLTKGGEEKWLKASHSLIIRNQDVSIIGSALDISAQMLLEESLREMAEVFQYAQIGIITMQGGFNRPVLINEAYASLHGYTVPEIENVPFLDLISPCVKEYSEKQIKAAEETGHHVFEAEHIRKDGSTFFALNDVTVFYGLSDKNFSAIVLVQDITAQKEAEKLQREQKILKESEKRLKDIINFFPDATFIIDKEQKVIFWNKAMEHLTGVKSEDILGKGNYEYSLPFYNERRPILIDLILEPKSEVQKKYTELKFLKNSIVAETCIPDFQGSTVYLWGIASPLYDEDGEITAIIESIRDVTDRKTVTIELKKAHDELEDRVRERTAQLYESEERFFALAYKTDNFIFEVRGDNFVYCNPATIRATGYSYEELLDKPFWEFFHPDYQNFVRNLANRRYKGDKVPSSYDVKIITKSGEERWFHVSPALAIRDKIQVIIGSGFDITDRINIENELRQSEERYRHVIEDQTEFLIRFYPGGEISFINHAVSKYFNLISEDLIRSNFFLLVPSDMVKKIKDNLSALTNPEDIRIIEYPFSKDIDTLRWHQWIFHGIFDSNGKFFEIQATGRDITKLKLAEIALRESEIKYRNLVESLNEGIWALDTEGITNFVNSRMSEMLGYNSREMIGISYYSFVPQSLHEDVHESLERRRAGIKERYEIFLLKKNGDLISAELSASPLFDNKGEYAGSFAVVVDITERKMTQEVIEQYTRDLESKNRALEELQNNLSKMNRNLDQMVIERTAQVEELLKQKDEFINQLGHDLKTPLTPVVALISELRNEEHGEYSVKLLDVISNNISYIRTIVDKTLKLAKLNTLGFQLEIEEFDLGNEILSVLEYHHHEFRRLGITAKMEFEETLFIKGDRILIRELFENLISNSIHDMGQNGGSIIVRGERMDDYLRISVIDTGIGLAKGECLKVFDEFYKADFSRHDKNSIGLGLTISQRIAESHHGIITVRSDGRGKGSTFIVEFPIRE